MPELPEIETVKLQLQKALVGLNIVSVSVSVRKIVQGDEKLCEGKKIIGIRRMAKVLIVDLADDISVAFHFKMTGQLIYISGKQRIAGGHPTEDFSGNLPSKHTRVIFTLTNNQNSSVLRQAQEENQSKLYFNDQRKFGWVIIDETEKINNLKFLKNLGPEPFEMKATEFIERLSRLRKPIKVAIMDQEIISGVGNIYANDACWEAKINPKKSANTLTKSEYEELLKAIIKVLREGIKYGGATAADAKYMNLHGLGGHYQEHFRTYDREGQKCLRGDKGIIEKITLGGRGTYYCQKCQK